MSSNSFNARERQEGDGAEYLKTGQWTQDQYGLDGAHMWSGIVGIPPIQYDPRSYLRPKRDCADGTASMTLETVQSLWIGDRLSTMEQLCIQSFLDHGHPFHLYCYQSIEGVPEGTVVRDGREILPDDEIFVYQRGCGKGSPSAFSNFFRYKLLLERGGWWADLDAFCMRPLDFEAEHVFGYEREKDGSHHLNCGLMKMPARSPIAAYCWSECEKADRARIRWGQTGPALTARAVEETQIATLLLPPEAFYPIDHFNFDVLIRHHVVPESSHSIHLWNSCWRRKGLDPDSPFDSQCIYEQLKARHGMSTPRDIPAPNASVAKAGRGWLLGSLSRLFSNGSRSAAA